MPTWRYTVDLKDVWRNEGLTFEERRTEIARRIRASRWAEESPWTVFHNLVDELAEVGSVEEFDQVWDEIYDYADMDRCWIATF